MSNHLLVPDLRSSRSWLSPAQSFSPPHESLLQSHELSREAEYSEMIVECNPRDETAAEPCQISEPGAETTGTAQTGQRVKILQFHGFEQFRILQRKLKFESEQSSCSSPNQSQDDSMGEFQSQLVHTQILESGVFHQRILMAATQRTLPSRIEETRTVRKQPEDKGETNDQRRESLDEGINISMCIGGEWICETLKIQDRNIRFSNFAIGIDCVSKLKIMLDEKEKSKVLIKITVDRSDYIISFGINPQEAKKHSFSIFLKIITLRFFSQIPSSKTDFQSFSTVKTGKLLKKSQYLSKWEERLVTIADGNLFSRKDEMSAPSFTIRAGRIHQLWTRFDSHLGFPVIKAQYDRKTEFGLPRTDFESWVVMFLSLLGSG